uniref:Uncharacterized protein n=1 Tax=Lepeophtheirus salmonis TaxID=72036 RepID=A0A0K2TSX5_LEPSM
MVIVVPPRLVLKHWYFLHHNGFKLPLVFRNAPSVCLYSMRNIKRSAWVRVLCAEIVTTSLYATKIRIGEQRIPKEFLRKGC